MKSITLLALLGSAAIGLPGVLALPIPIAQEATVVELPNGQVGYPIKREAQEATVVELPNGQVGYPIKREAAPAPYIKHPTPETIEARAEDDDTCCDFYIAKRDEGKPSLGPGPVKPHKRTALEFSSKRGVNVDEVSDFEWTWPKKEVEERGVNVDEVSDFEWTWPKKQVEERDVDSTS